MSSAASLIVSCGVKETGEVLLAHNQFHKVYHIVLHHVLDYKLVALVFRVAGCNHRNGSITHICHYHRPHLVLVISPHLPIMLVKWAMTRWF